MAELEKSLKKIELGLAKLAEVDGKVGEENCRAAR